MDFHKIIIVSNQKKIRVFRKIQGYEEYNIPDQVSISSNVEVEDSVVNGTSILYPNTYLFPRDLNQFIGKDIKFQLTDGSQITGKFISFEDDKAFKKDITRPFDLAADQDKIQRIIIEASKCHSEKLSKELPNGLISILTSHIQSYFPLDFELLERSTKIKFNDNTEREVIVSYDVPLSLDSFSSGYFSHIIKGIDFKTLSTDPNLDSNIPITFKTIYYWVPQWDIQNEDVTLSLISDDNKETFTVKNFKCTKNYLTQITVNEFSTNATRAVLVYPLGAIRISLFFQNNSDFIISSFSKINFNSELDLSLNSNSACKKGEPFSLFKPFVPTSSTLLNDVKPNKVGVISFNFENSIIKVYKDIAHQPLWDSKARDFTITGIKTSNIFTLVDTETKSKINFQFVNATDYKTKYIVNLGKHIQENYGEISSNGKEIEEKSLYLFDSYPLSMSTFQITHSQKKTYMTHHKLPVVLINYLIEKGIQIKINKDKFETYDLSVLDRNTQDTIYKLMSNLYLEEKTSNYFNRSDGSLSNIQSLFSESNFNKSPASFYNNNTNVGLFGSSVGTFGAAQPSASLFGATQSNTSPFGATQSSTSPFGATQSSTSLFGATQPSASLFGAAQTTSASGFGTTQATSAPTSRFGFSGFGQSITPATPSAPSSQSPFGATQTTSASGFAGQPTSAPTSTPSFGFGGQPTTTPTSTPSFGFGCQPTSAPTSTPSFGFGASQATYKSEESENNSDTDSLSSFVSIPSSTQSQTSFLGSPTSASTPTNLNPSLVTPKDGLMFASITAKDEFSNKSFEELKLEHNNKTDKK